MKATLICAEARGRSSTYLVLWTTLVAIAVAAALMGTVIVKVHSRRSYLGSRASRRRASKYTFNRMEHLLTRLESLAITSSLR
jgi:hypothetical protein